ncbi:hypothetical protein WL29_22400 [Burkholderia ubonensis]|uniref:Uncharacterized protein n=1 Tax=Burkholderia ubonensis TaxID=101571 RepID=A0A119HFL3_9BURK|nr:hypothetical protein [Burkholderia ubonensis]KWA84119.1 hypothetical protein WL29_22400 [Burkholderia ubonensis]
MNEQLKTNLATLRQRIRQLRADHYKARFEGGARTWCHDPVRRDQVLQTQGRLSYLVPLYRALIAAVQQQKDGKGAQLYVKRFDALRGLLRKVGNVTLPGTTYHTYLGDDVLELQLPVPAECHSAVCWKFQSISELLDEVKAQLKAEQQAAHQRARAAEDARKGFLASLTPYQVLCLKHALEAAKEKGTYAITIDERDLEAL